MVLSLEVEVPDFMSVSQSQLPGRVISNHECQGNSLQIGVTAFSSLASM